MRLRALRSYYGLLSDISEFMKAHPNIHYRYLVQASESPLPEYDLLNFNAANAKQGIDLGIKDAKAEIERGPGVSFKQFAKGFTVEPT